MIFYFHGMYLNVVTAVVGGSRTARCDRGLCALTVLKKTVLLSAEGGTHRHGSVGRSPKVSSSMSAVVFSGRRDL